MCNLARFTLRNMQIFAQYRAPRDIGRASASPAIDAMTIDQCNRRALQHVSRLAAHASTRKLHSFFNETNAQA